MKYIGTLIFVFASTLISSCANDLLGASMIIYKFGGSGYVERWYLNPKYNRKDIPTGTAFYGAAAEKSKDKFIVKYYIYDSGKSNVEIPRSDMWIVNHNGKRWSEQDDDNLFFYEKIGLNGYKVYVSDRTKKPLTIGEDRLLPVQSCDDEGWCRMYPNSDINELYVKKIILKEPLQPELTN